MSFLTSHLLAEVPSVLHGFGTTSEPIPSPFAADWEERHPLRQQVHGTAIAEVTEPRQQCGKVDGLMTREPGQPISAVTADCVPVLLTRQDGACVAAIHAGWRGTRARILRELWSRLTGEGERPGDWRAAIGPAIGPCCYQVSEELAQGFAAEFASLLPRERILPAPRMLDLPAINEAELRDIGVGGVEVLRACTRCALGPDGKPRFQSFRREGGGQRQWAAIAIR